MQKTFFTFRLKWAVLLTAVIPLIIFIGHKFVTLKAHRVALESLKNENALISSEGNGSRISVELLELRHPSRLTDIRGLSEVTIDTPSIKCLDELGSLPDLKRLVIHDGSSLIACGEVDFPKLTHLKIHKCNIADFGSFRRLAKLRSIDLQQCSTDPLESLPFIENLEVLILRDNPLDDLSPIVKYKTLRRLDLNRIKVGDSCIIRRLANLEKLRLVDCQVHCLTWLDGLPLKSLNLRGSQIKSWADLPRLDGLWYLNFSQTNMSDTAWVLRLPRLTEVDLSKTLISECRDLTTLEQLELLDLSSTNISVLSPLLANKRLEELIIVGTRATEEEILELKRGLPNCTIVDYMGMIPDS